MDEAEQETPKKKAKEAPSSAKKGKGKKAKAEEDADYEAEEDGEEEDSASTAVPIANMQAVNRPASKFALKFVSWNVNGIKAWVKVCSYLDSVLD